MPLPSSDKTWSIRSLLQPVVARLLIYGINPFDLERVLQHMESAPLRNARQMERRWLEAWETLARAWEERSHSSGAHRSRPSVRDLRFQAAACRLAQFLINPGDLEERRARYLDYVASYRLAADQFVSPVLSVEIPLSKTSSLAAHLHLPAPSPKPHPCVAVFSGLGSCKEEMNTLARFMVERGVAALVPDMPGSGESLFRQQVVCSSQNLSAAFGAVADFVGRRADLDASRFGVSGLCMGGGYAYRACHEDSRYRWCAVFFPLFINQVDQAHTPQWMRSGPWYDYQTGKKDASQFLAEVGWRDEYTVSCPFFMVHGKHDNWMTLDRARLLYDHATSSNRHLLVIDEPPVYSTGQAVTHTMPVGEQLCWVGPLVGDWIAEQAGIEADRESER